jgi:bifunctional non-homologous end joining protein LigD
MVTRPKAISPDQKARIRKAPTPKTRTRKSSTAQKGSDRLETYRAKRRFGITPEPAPREESSQGPAAEGKKTAAEPATRLAFVVQKHDARRLHYDFRLEIDGAMASWAVPRGPSYDPTVRRLAVQTEDHPMEYNAFEGRIPEGEYGAGDVLIWDRGTYETVPPDQQRVMIDKGHLHVRLFGEKLVGDWHLLRTDRRGGDDGAGGSGKAQWLLFKAKDSHANPAYDVIAERPASVVSQRVATRGPARVSASEHGKSARALLEAVGGPALATPATTMADPSQWLFEAKYDGYRVLVCKAGSDVRVYTRRANDWTDRFRPIADAVARLRARECVVDGEACVVDESGRPSFGALQEWLAGSAPNARIAYATFDLLWLDGRDLRREPLEVRRELLEKLLEGHGAPLSYSRAITGDVVELLRAAKQAGLEGLVAKKKGSPYVEGRSGLWLKLRFDRRQDCAIAGWIPMAGTTDEVGALLLAIAEGEKLVFAGRVGTGFDTRTRRELAKSLAADAVDSPAIEGAPALARPSKARDRAQTGPNTAGAHWVRPRLVCECAFAEWTRDGSMRAPRYLGLREDKTPLECVREGGTEQGDDPAPPGPPIAAAAHRGGYRGSGARPSAAPTLANPSKVLFPRDGITKRDIWDYYTRIAPLLLPHLAGRPLTLQRYPDGIDGEEWYQQNAPDKIPGFVRLVDVGPRHENKKRIVCDNLETLQWLANLAALTIHQWSSHAPGSAASRAATDHALACPDYVVLDLDPGAGPWEHLVEVAGAVRALLEALELRSLVKTSGKRGLHVVVPTSPGPTHEQATGFAEQVARAVAKVLPKVATVERMKEKRGGKLYVDYGQNGEGRTIVSPYTIRARDGAVVSTPIDWSEVTNRLDPTRFTIRSVLDRVEKRGDLFAGVLQGGQVLPLQAVGASRS